MYDEVIMMHGREFQFAVGDRLRAINLAYNRLTTRNRLDLFLTDFLKYTFSDGHFTMIMQCDVTGSGPWKHR